MKTKIFLILFVLMGGYILWKNLTLPETIGVVDGKLHCCSRKPNCVSSFSKGEKHFIEPIVVTQDRIDVLHAILHFLYQNYKVKVITETPTYLHVVVSTNTFRFKDDLEFLFNQEKRLIYIRSASRVGYFDMGVNRERIEKLRKYLDQKNFAR